MSDKIPVQDVTPPSPAKKGESVDLYAKREQIYTKAFTGLFRNIRLVSGAFLFLMFFGTAWLNWGDRQAVWWNLPERKFYIFGATFWPQDFMLLSWLLIICAFGLFFITVFAGRVWCGYTCPQSVWTWVYMWAEKVTEGDRNQRMKLDKQPMSAEKFLRKAAKHSIWLGVALLTALTFVGYFTPIRQLTVDLFTFNIDGWALFWVGFFTLATYGNAGWLREQVCIHMCPYSRFQSVMFDKDTLIVSYNEKRGERRGPRKKDADYKAMGLGDCIDCKMCVHVCPTGIDIRNGLQIACIGCAACVDACDSIMDKMNYPRGLVGYTTEHNLNGHKTHIVRPRLIGYAIALLIMTGAFATALYMRPLAELDVIKDRVLYRENEEGRIENVYTLKIMNKDQRDHVYTIDVSGLDGLVFEGRREVKAVAGEILSVPLELSIDPEQLPSSTNEILFTIQAADIPGKTFDAESRFIGPSVR
ncbi:Ubp3 associated protein Bre5 [compost metagenome]